MSGLVLSIFPGIGLLDMAFEEEGFCVVRGPDLLWGGDIKRFHPPAGKFDGVIGGPPCQAFSRLRHIVEAQGKTLAPNMIPEFERVVCAAQPDWFLMENVPDAPEPDVEGYSLWSGLFDNRLFGGPQKRERRFSFGAHTRTPLTSISESIGPINGDWSRAVTCDSREVPVKVGGTGKFKGGGMLPNTGKSLAVSEMAELQGLPSDFLAEAPFTMSGKRKAIGNGVPLPMGRAVAKAVKKAIEAHP